MFMMIKTKTKALVHSLKLRLDKVESKERKVLWRRRKRQMPPLDPEEQRAEGEGMIAR